MLLSSSELLEWADPNEDELVGHALSQEHLADITGEVAARRQQFLVDAVRMKIDGDILSGLDTTDGIDFSSIPVRFVMDRDEHYKLACEAWARPSKAHYYAWELKSYWTKLADIHMRLMGQPFATYTRHSDSYLKPWSPSGRWTKSDEKRVQERIDDATHITESGYPIRFLDLGASYTQLSALDMNSVAEWVRTRDEKDYPPVFWTPIGFWPAMVKAKRAYDKSVGRKTYADVVSSPLPGLFVAPYIDEAVDASPDYFHFDDIFHRAALERLDETMATRALRTMVKLLCEDEDQFKVIKHQYFRQPAAGGKPGIMFFRADVLPEVLDRADERGVKGKAIQLLEDLERKYCPAADEYGHLVFN